MKKILSILLINTFLCLGTGCAINNTSPEDSNSHILSLSPETDYTTSDLLEYSESSQTGSEFSSTNSGTKNSEPVTDNLSNELGQPIISDILQEDFMDNNCKLIVKGRDITSEVYVYLHEEIGYVDLPITAIMEELGATVVWTDGIVTISFEGKTTTYDTTIPYFGMPLPPGGKYMARKVIAGDLVLDDIAVRPLLNAWTGAKIYVDSEHKIIEIK